MNGQQTTVDRLGRYNLGHHWDELPLLLDISLFLPSLNWCNRHCSQWGWEIPPKQKQFTCWSHQSTVCKENLSVGYTDSLMRFLWKATCYSKYGQKWEFVVSGGSESSSWTGKLGLFSYHTKARHPNQYKESQRSSSLVILQPTKVLIFYYASRDLQTEHYMLDSTVGPISETRNL